MAPFGVPEKKALLERGKIGVGGLSEAFEGERLGCGKNVVKAPNDGKGRLAMIPDGDLVAVSELKIGFIPLQNVLAALVFSEENLRTEEANLQSWEMVPLTLECGNASSIVEDLVLEASFLMCNELSSNAIKGEWRRKINERTRDEIR
jgi:hypothetical protein